MPVGEKQKQKLLQLANILTTETDEEHPIRTNELISKLEAVGVTVTRQTLQHDLDDLRDIGLDVQSRHVYQGTVYYLGTHTFSLPELKLLVDAVQSSRFITAEKSQELIKKIESLGSKYQATELHRSVIISGRIKAMNESIFLNVDAIHEGINTDRQIQFHYFQWGHRGEQKLRNNGALFTISPWALVWQDDNYYMIGYDSTAQLLKNYRVDKMLDIDVISLPREGREAWKQMDTAKYSRAMFGMFGGDQARVKLEATKAYAIGALIDRFGKDNPIIEVEPGVYQTFVDVVPSVQFFGWVMGLEGAVRIIGPEDVVENMKKEVRRQMHIYYPSTSQDGQSEELSQ